MRASRGHKSVPVEVGGAFQDGVVYEHRSQGHGFTYVREGVCACAEGVAE